MTYLTKAEILAADDAKFAEVDVQEWGGKVRVRTISGTERDQFDEYQDTVGKKGVRLGTRAFFCAMTICDETGKRTFDPKDVESLGKKSIAALDRVFTVSLRLNGIGNDAIEERGKNSQGGPSEDSGTSSPAPSPTPASSEQNS